MPYYHKLRCLPEHERKRVIDRLLLLRKQLDNQIPAKTSSETLLLATWNIREFGLGNRLEESFYYIAEIISRFDLVAIQEVSADLKGLEKVAYLLGYSWDYIVTDSTDGSAGGGERMAFLYDKGKVTFRKMAGEIVLPKDKLINGCLQFARTPFCVSFQAGWFKFLLTTVHIFYGKSSGIDPVRLAEIDMIASCLAKRAKKEEASYILLGDFNIVKCEDPTMGALEKHGFIVPDPIKEHPTDLGRTKHYDQIAFNLKLRKNMPVFSEGKQKAGAFNFTESIYSQGDLNEYLPYFSEKNTAGKTEKEIEKYYLSKWRTFQVSDHLPLWVELKVDFSNEYLKQVKDEECNHLECALLRDKSSLVTDY